MLSKSMALHSQGNHDGQTPREESEQTESGATGGTPSVSSSVEYNNSNVGSNVTMEEFDSVDGAPSDKHKKQLVIDQLQLKIQRTMDQIRDEQNAKEENVNEYLKVSTSSNVDKQQLQRIKNVFEKKNQKSTQLVSQLQKKLDNYKRRLRDTQLHGVSGNKQSSGHKQVIVYIYMLGAFDRCCTIDRTRCADNGLLDRATIDQWLHHQLMG